MTRRLHAEPFRRTQETPEELRLEAMDETLEVKNR